MYNDEKSLVTIQFSKCTEAGHEGLQRISMAYGAYDP